MKNIFYKPKDGWVGDTIPFAHDGKFYIYYLHKIPPSKKLKCPLSLIIK